MNELAFRPEITAFLKSRRARLRPEDVGLSASRRRRTTGLRREDVAALAGVGDTWYGLLESGRRIQVSSRLIESISAALRLNDAELAYLRALVVDDEAAGFDYESDLISDAVAEILALLTTAPAFVIGPRLDYVAVNALARALYRFPEPRDPVFENLVTRMFLSPRAPEIYEDWESAARHTVAKFRHAYGRHVGNASFKRLIDRLSAESPAFTRFWDKHEVGRQHDAVSESVISAEGAYHFRLQAFDILLANRRSSSCCLLTPPMPIS